MTGRKDRLDGLAVATLALLSTLWGLHQVVVKLANAEIPPAMQAGLRSVGAALLLWLWSAARGIRLGERDGTLGEGLTAGLLFALEFAVLYWALDFASVSHTVLFLYTSPFVVALGAHFFVPGERLMGVQALGLACAFAGLLVGFADVLEVPTWRELIGDGLALLAALLWGATTVLIKAGRLAQAAPAKTLMYQLAVSAVLLPLLSLMIGERIERLPGSFALAALAYQVVVVAFLSYLAWFWLVRHYPASRISAFSFLTPLLGALAGGLLLGERLSWLLGIALLFVSAGIYLVNRPPAPAPLEAASCD